MKITHKGVLDFGDITPDCYVTDTGDSVLSINGAVSLMGFKSTKDLLQLGAFFRALSKKGYDVDDIRVAIDLPQLVSVPGGGRDIKPLTATIVTKMCLVTARAQREGKLRATQAHVGQQCQKVLDAAAFVGIAALVHEATGYQRVRPEDALITIWQNWAPAGPPQPWEKTFNDSFYAALYRLRGWKYIPGRSRHPTLVAKDTLNIVYSRIVPGLLPEMLRRNPITESGKRLVYLHQLFNLESSRAALKLRIHDLTVMMSVFDASQWYAFITRLDSVFPVQPDQLELEPVTEPTPEDLEMLTPLSIAELS